MLAKVFVFVGVLMLAGCASHPTYVSCIGNGKLTTRFDVLAYAGTATTSAECGEGFSFEVRKYAPKERPVKPEPGK